GADHRPRAFTVAHHRHHRAFSPQEPAKHAIGPVSRETIASGGRAESRSGAAQGPPPMPRGAQRVSDRAEMAVALFLTTKNVDATLFRRTTAWFHVKPGVGFAETHVPA